MTVWEFRRRVRAHRAKMAEGCCPLGAAAGKFYPTHPLPWAASRHLHLASGYAFGIVAGFDFEQTPPTPLPDDPLFDAGERYGRRMRKVAKLRGYL